MAKVTPTAIDLQRVDRIIDTAKSSHHAIWGTLEEVAIIREEERETFLDPSAKQRIEKLEEAIVTMLPEGTMIDEVLADPSKWKAKKEK